MEFIADIPIGLLVPFIFVLRIVDVSMGTIRTLAIVEGRIGVSVVLGFFEVLVWLVAITQVIVRLKESPFLPLAYAAGFAAGNAAGILLEKRLALGSVVLRIISETRGSSIAEALRSAKQAVTTFDGAGRDGPVTLIYTSCPRAEMHALLGRAVEVDPDLFYVIERANAWGHGRAVVAHPTGWRAFWKKK